MSQQDIEGRDNLPILIPSNRELNFGLRWDFIGDEPFDLDVSCVSFDKAGNPGTVVYFNKLTAEGDWMIHTGDNTTGEGDDDDEAIQVFLSKVPAEVYHLMLVITCHNKTYNLGNVDSVTCEVTDMTVEEQITSIPVRLSKDHTATIVCELKRSRHIESSSPRGRKTHEWELIELNLPAQGHNVGDLQLLQKMRDLLEIPEELRDKKALHVNINTDKQTAGTQVSEGVTHLVFGVGWSKDEDLDCTVIYFDKNGEYVDHVNSKNKLVSTDMACIHRGDNVVTTADPKSSDKEKVDIHITRISSNVDTLFFAVSTVERDGEWNTKLASVTGAYCRLFEVKKKKVGKGTTHNQEDRRELVRTNLTKLSRETIGLVFAALYRDSSKSAGWTVLPVVEPINKLRVASISPSEFMPITRALSYFIRNGFKDPSGMWVPGGWEQFRESARVKQIMTLTVVKGRGLGPQGKTFACHCIIWTMDRGKQCEKARTVCCYDRECPVWNETFEFGVTLFDSLKFMCFDKNFIGSVEIPLVKYRFNFHELADCWHKLQGSDVEGEIHLQMSLRVDTNGHKRRDEAGESRCSLS